MKKWVISVFYKNRLIDSTLVEANSELDALSKFRLQNPQVHVAMLYEPEVGVKMPEVDQKLKTLFDENTNS